MISNERPSPYGPRSGANSQRRQQTPRREIPEEIPEETIQVERKTFILTLKENPRGRFLRVTEDVNGRRDNIIIPTTGLEDFSNLVAAMVKTSDETEPKLT
ncbi:MAG: hypothetical protein ACJASX_003846 [Limisphaerales bacterium]|jgi:hypothetical protein